jgi:hypothetical protein
MGFAEVADFLGIQKSWATNITHRPEFPKPIASLAATRVWNAQDIWEYKWKIRKPPGRPRKAASG